MESKNKKNLLKSDEDIKKKKDEKTLKDSSENVKKKKKKRKTGVTKDEKKIETIAKKFSKESKMRGNNDIIITMDKNKKIKNKKIEKKQDNDDEIINMKDILSEDGTVIDLNKFREEQALLPLSIVKEEVNKLSKEEGIKLLKEQQKKRTNKVIPTKNELDKCRERLDNLLKQETSLKDTVKVDDYSYNDICEAIGKNNEKANYLKIELAKIQRAKEKNEGIVNACSCWCCGPSESEKTKAREHIKNGERGLRLLNIRLNRIESVNEKYTNYLNSISSSEKPNNERKLDEVKKQVEEAKGELANLETIFKQREFLLRDAGRFGEAVLEFYEKMEKEKTKKNKNGDMVLKK